MRIFILILVFVTVKASPEVDPKLVNSGHGQAHNPGRGIGDQGFHPGNGNGGQGFNPGRNENGMGGQGFNQGKYVGGQGFNPGRDESGIGGQGFNLGIYGNRVGGQGFNPGRDENGIGGQGFNLGRTGNGIGGQGFNPGRTGRGDDMKFVAFTVVRAVQGSQIGRLRFERTVTDVGYGWDRVTNSLKVSSAGAYHFSWSALSPRDTELRLSLMRNGREQVASWADKDGFNTAAGSALLVLEVGDTVYLHVTEGAVYEPPQSDRPYTTFTAFKI